jgi:hypothetical protein
VKAPKKSRFNVTKLEARIAPAPAMVRIPSTNVDDPAVNGAEHACKGLSNAVNNPNQAVQLFRHGCTPPPPPDCPPPPPPPCGCGGS